MQATKTLFIVGAGASCEFGIPAGKELATRISRMLDFNKNAGDDLIRATFAAANQNRIKEAFGAIQDMSDGLILTPSIDQYLDIHRSDQYKSLAGKLAIVKSILDAESMSSLTARPGDRIDFAQGRRNTAPPTDTWLGELFRLLQEGVRMEEPERIFNNLKFIVFNYDRCIEQFLSHAVARLFSASQALTAKILRSVEIIHPYGRIGTLPMFPGDELTIPYGETQISGEALIGSSRNIRTFTEEVTEGDRLEELRKHVAENERVIFLGFAFHQQNMDLLRPRFEPGAREIFATTHGQSPRDTQVTLMEVRRCFAGSYAVESGNNALIELSSDSARDFLVSFGRYLRLAPS